jgi:hypothetical protein
MRTRLKLPFITDFYEKKICRGTCELTFYNFFALSSAIPLTITFKSFYNNTNLFTKDESAVLLTTMNPGDYIDNLVQFAMQDPGRNATLLRDMYRTTVSYLIGSGYASGQFFSGLVGMIFFEEVILYFFRAPFELLSYFTNYPWSWYSNTVTRVGLNIRFLSWYLQFTALLFGWPAKWLYTTGLDWVNWLAVLINVVPNTFLIIKVWLQDLELINDQLGPSYGVQGGATTLDVTLRCISRLLIMLPRLFLALKLSVYQPLAWGSFGLMMRSIIMMGATLNYARLLIDIPNWGIYTV